MHIQNQRAWPVAVFAHNEEREIISCLESLLKASAHPLACYVLANACSDKTEMLVTEYSKSHPNVHLVSIALGDKANAWNVFVHDHAPQDADYYFFIDGDVQAGTLAIDRLAIALDDTPYANGASALPDSGRNIERFKKDMLDSKGLAGNLYALRGTFVARLKSQHIRMPIGLIGEDALIGAMLKWDLSGETRWDDNRIVIANNAVFEFEPMKITRPSNWKKYYRRRVRYSIRGFQNRALGPSIQSGGFTKLPQYATELFKSNSSVLSLRWKGVDTLFDWIALQEISTAIATISVPGNHEKGSEK